MFHPQAANQTNKAVFNYLFHFYFGGFGKPFLLLFLDVLQKKTIIFTWDQQM